MPLQLTHTLENNYRRGARITYEKLSLILDVVLASIVCENNKKRATLSVFCSNKFYRMIVLESHALHIQLIETYPIHVQLYYKDRVWNSHEAKIEYAAPQEFIIRRARYNPDNIFSAYEKSSNKQRAGNFSRYA